MISDDSERNDVETLTVRVADSQHDTSPHITFVVFALSTSRNKSAVLRHLRLLWSEEVCAGVVRPVGKTPEANNRDKDGHNALKEKEPLPRMKPGNVVHVSQDGS